MKICALWLLATLSLVRPEPMYRNLVLEGGGFKAISYIGALKALKDQGYYSDAEGRWSFENIAGTSSGCLIGFIMSLDIEPNRLERIFFDFDVEHLLPHTFRGLPIFKSKASFLSRLSNLVYYSASWFTDDSPGFDTDEHVMEWLFEFVLPHSRYHEQVHRGTTFGELAAVTGHRLFCYASRLHDNSLMEYNPDETRRFPVSRAIYASISLPIFFKPSIDEATGLPLVDGGLFNNFPITAFDSQRPSEVTLGLSLHRNPYTALQECRRPETCAKIRYHGTEFREYLSLLYLALINHDVAMYAKNDLPVRRIVYLESPLRTLEFELSEEAKRAAIGSAYALTMEFFAQRRPKSVTEN